MNCAWFELVAAWLGVGCACVLLLTWFAADMHSEDAVKVYINNYGERDLEYFLVPVLFAVVLWVAVAETRRYLKDT